MLHHIGYWIIGFVVIAGYMSYKLYRLAESEKCPHCAYGYIRHGTCAHCDDMARALIGQGAPPRISQLKKVIESGTGR